MHTDKSKNSVYVYYTRISDRLSYSSADASELAENLLARGLDELYGIALSKEERSKGPHGKPYLVNHPKIHYNISHSGRFVLCAISGVPVGIDIQQKRIVDAIYGLPDAGDIKVMKGHEGLYRLRVGDIRILYTMEEEILTIYVIEIGNRGDIYK